MPLRVVNLLNIPSGHPEGPRLFPAWEFVRVCGNQNCSCKALLSAMTLGVTGIALVVCGNRESGKRNRTLTVWQGSCGGELGALGEDCGCGGGREGGDCRTILL